MSVRRLAAMLLAGVTVLGPVVALTATPAGASSLPINTTIAPAWGKGTLTIVRTAWTVTVKGTLTDTRADGDCVYVEAVLEVDNWPDPDSRTPNHCGGNGTSRSVDLAMTPGKGSRLSRVRVRVCAADSFADSCSEKIFTVPVERAVQPGKKATIDSYRNSSMATFQAAKRNGGQGLDWSDDGCSSPTGDRPGGFNFLPACQRHDFGYRNYGKGAVKASPFDSTRDLVDDRFASDMTNVCNGYSGKARTDCLGWAGTYYSAVHLEGGRAFYRNN